MGARNREIESKWYTSKSMDDVRTILEDVLGSKLSNVVSAKGTDYYWALTDSKFIRLRDQESTCQITVKSKDKGHNGNRIEVDVSTSEPAKQVERLLTLVHGEPTGELTKTYWVYWIKGEDQHTNVSLYTVKGHSGTFIEIEASTQAKFNTLENVLVGELKDEGLDMQYEPKSMYELFILPMVPTERFVL